MTLTAATEGNPRRSEGDVPGPSLPEIVDWLSAAVILICGLLSMLAGTALQLVFDRDELAERIEDGTTATIATTELSVAETLELAHEVVWWTGIGFLGIGIVTIVFALGFVIVRHRAHRRVTDGEAINSIGANAIFGGVVGVLLAFVPFSPAIGGALGGYFERKVSDRTVSAGALSGAVTSTPLIAIVIALAVGFVAGLAEIGLPGIALLAGLTMAFVVGLAVTTSAVLGAIGGYLGGRLARR